MVDEAGMEDDLGGHRGNAQDLFKLAIEEESKFKAFGEMIAKRSDKDELYKKYEEFDEDFAEALLGAERDNLEATSAWNAVDEPGKLQFAKHWASDPEISKFITDQGIVIQAISDE